MKARETITPRFAICVDISEYPVCLELHKVYRVVPDKEAEQEDDMRIVEERRGLPLSGQLFRCS